MSWTYDKSLEPEVYRLRRLIRDVNLDVTNEADRRANTAFFEDEELKDFLEEANGDYYLAAADALFTLLADNRAMMTSLKLGTYGENYQVGIERLARRYLAKSEEYQPRTEVVEIDTGRDAVDEYLDRGTEYAAE